MTHPQLTSDLVDRPARRPDQLNRVTPELFRVLRWTPQRGHPFLWTNIQFQGVHTSGEGHITAYECQATSFHLEDHAPVNVEILPDGEPRIGEDDQVTLLRLGLQVADVIAHLVRELPEPVPVRCIIAAGSTNGTFRLHQLRPGMSWLADNLDDYRGEKLITVDITPMPTT